MAYKEIYKEKNEEVKERFSLVMERIAEIQNEKMTEAPYRDYFSKVSTFILMCKEVLDMEEKGLLEKRSLAECKEWNHKLYADICFRQR